MERPGRIAILRGVPKVDLHRHLEGAIRPQTLLELARLRGLNLPLDSLDALLPHITIQEGQPRNLAHFLSKFRSDWYASYADVERVTGEVVEDAAAEGVIHLELRFSPEHLSKNSGLDLKGVMQAVVESGHAAADDAGMGLRFLVTFARERLDPGTWKTIVDFAVDLSDRGIVGVDLAGDELGHPNREFERFMERVRDTGVLARSIHAGEGTGPEQVRSAVESLFANRIGHGLAAVFDPSVVDMLRNRQIGLEMCPISNFLTGCVDDPQKHPLPLLDQSGVLVTINSDDPCIQCSSLPGDYDLAVTRWGYDLHDLHRLERNAVQIAFLSPDERQKLLSLVDAGYHESMGQGL